MSFENILAAASEKAEKAEKALYKKSAHSASLADIGRKYGFPTLEKIKSWKDLYNARGHLILPCEEFTEEEIIEAAEDGNILMSSADPYKRTKSLIFNLLETLISTHKDKNLFNDNLFAWAKKEIAGYTRGNPEKIAAQLCEYGIHSGEPGFCLDTPKNWKKRGYKLKYTARPFFVVTPLFTPEDEKKAEEAGQAIAEAPAEGEEAEAEAKKPERKYAIHALFCPQDTEKEREITRRSPKKSENATRAEAMRAEAEKPKKTAKKPKKAAPAPAATPAPTEDDIMQLALSL